MWPAQSGWVGYPFYIPHQRASEAPHRRFQGRCYSKLYWKKDKASQDAHMRRWLKDATTRHPVGGLMVRIQPTCVVRSWSARAHLRESPKFPIPVKTVLNTLGLAADQVGITGSTLLTGSLNTDACDLDLVVYTDVDAKRCKSAIREIIRERPDARLPGHWSRPHHHRRAAIAGVQVCPSASVVRTEQC